MLAQVDMTWWTVGWIVGAVVVVAVVLLACAIILLATQIRSQAREITGVLHATEASTRVLWSLRAVRGAASEIVYDLRQGRSTDVEA